MKIVQYVCDGEGCEAEMTTCEEVDGKHYCSHCAKRAKDDC